ETATGRQAFAGATTAVIYDAILNRAPTPPLRVNPDLPPEFERIINKTLEKDCDLRYQHASDIRADLKRLKRETESGRTSASAAVTQAQAAPPAQARRAVRTWAIAAGAAILIVAALAVYLLSRPLPPPRVLAYIPVT